MAKIYHITTAEAWKKAQVEGVYSSPALNAEGFIHCCEASQVDYIKDKYYQGVSDLLELTIDTDKLSSQFIFEWSPSLEQTFPHVYGPINLDSVVATESK